MLLRIPVSLSHLPLLEDASGPSCPVCQYSRSPNGKSLCFWSHSYSAPYLNPYKILVQNGTSGSYRARTSTKTSSVSPFLQFSELEGTGFLFPFLL